MTGADGFLGRRVVARLAGHDVVPASRRTGVDVRDHARILAAAEGCDAIVHLAGIARGSPEELALTNVGGTANVVDAALAQGARLVLASSAGAARPVTPYGQSKAAAEDLVAAAAPRLPGAAILRLFNLYGDGDEHGVVSRFLRESPITVEGNGHAVRDYVHVDDVANAIACCLHVEGLLRSDVGSGVGLSVLQLAKLFNKPILHGPAPGAQIMHSIARPSAIPDWKPTIRIEDWVKAHRGGTA